MSEPGQPGPTDGPAGVRRVTILGSTGSIGTQALSVIAANRDRFAVTALTAGGSGAGSLDLLARQAVEFRVPCVGVAEATVEELAAAIREAGDLSAGGARGSYRPELLAGPHAATRVAALPTDVVLNGITGSIGLLPTLAALTAGHRLALANKESLIVGGQLVKGLSSGTDPNRIVPVDSEHSAIFQCLRGADRGEIRRLIITASGGPFRDWAADRLASVTPAQALAHPNFAMGKVITTNSATLVNKGLEVVEAHLLFDVPFEAITVVVHPQQQVHSMVEFHDGATLAQAGPPRMLVPIALGMSWPERLVDVDEPCDWTTASSWDFAPLDTDRFPAVPLAYRVGRAGGTFPAVYNAANEEAVEAFHAGSIPFPDIVGSVVAAVDEWEAGGGLALIDDATMARAWERVEAVSELLGRLSVPSVTIDSRRGPGPDTGATEISRPDAEAADAGTARVGANKSPAEGVAQVLAAEAWARARARGLVAR